MRALTVTLVFFTVFSFPPVLHAQDAALLPVITYDADGDVIGTGPKGRLSREQAQVLALQHVRGQVLESDVYLTNDDYFYTYKILTQDQSIYDVDLYAATGELYSIKIEYLAENAALPFSVLPQEQAELLATAYVNDRTLGRRDPKILSTEIAVRDRKAVYVFQLKKSGKTYDLFLNAADGAVLEFKEQ